MCVMIDVGVLWCEVSMSSLKKRVEFKKKSN